MRDIFFANVDLPNRRNGSLPVTRSHLKIFGIGQSAVHYLDEAHKTVRGIEREQAHDLDHYERVKAMCLDYCSPAGPLPINQCLRWELLLQTIDEIYTIHMRFGDGMTDKLE